MLKWFGALTLAAALAGCATTRPPLTESFRQAPATGPVGTEYRLPRLASQSGNSDSLAVILSFSGGGTRAAAFAYGVLKEFKSAPVLWNGARTTLFDEVDVVAGVSGGSVAAAYFAAFGDEIFQSFEPAFPKSDFQGGALSSVRSPANAYRLSSPWFGRSHLLAERLDETLFRGITYGDLAVRGTRPFLLVTATDLTQGTGFEFSQGQSTCHIPDSTDPLALAVAASSAVPVVMSPVTLANKAGKCAAPPAPAVSPRLAAADAYLDPEQRPFIHLIDGGLSDNLAVRGIIDAIATPEGWLGAGDERLQGSASCHRQRERSRLNTALDPVTRCRRSPRSRRHRVGDARPAFQRIAEILARGAACQRIARCGACWQQYARPVRRSNVIEIVAGPSRPELRGELMAIPTSFSLPTEDVDKLIAAGGKILRESAEFVRLRKDISIDKARKGYPGAARQRALAVSIINRMRGIQHRRHRRHA